MSKAESDAVYLGLEDIMQRVGLNKFATCSSKRGLTRHCNAKTKHGVETFARTVPSGSLSVLICQSLVSCLHQKPVPSQQWCLGWIWNLRFHKFTSFKDLYCLDSRLINLAPWSLAIKTARRGPCNIVGRVLRCVKGEDPPKLQATHSRSVPQRSCATRRRGS